MDFYFDKIPATQVTPEMFGMKLNTKKAKDLDPMNNIRKAGKGGDWVSVLVEYMANKANLSHLIPENSEEIGVKHSQKPSIPKKLLEK